MDLVKVEDEIQFADVVEVFVQDFDEVVNRLQIRQVVVSYVNTDAKVEASITSVDDLEISELQMGLVGCKN